MLWGRLWGGFRVSLPARSSPSPAQTGPPQPLRGGAAILAALGTTEQEMTGPWVKSPRPPTQWLGQFAYDSGRIAGIKYASAKHPGGLNLVAFPDRIPATAGNFLEVHDPHGKLAQRIGP